MTTIYVPQRIESAEQAEALPIGTIALFQPEDPDRFENHAAVKIRPEETSENKVLWLVDSGSVDSDSGMVGWTALIPVEAAEEKQLDPGVFKRINARMRLAQMGYGLAHWPLEIQHVRRLVTPWEVAS
ncbi:hypothetical protein ACXET9_07200 [Brachybacterium sp. DNPG3]